MRIRLLIALISIMPPALSLGQQVQTTQAEPAARTVTQKLPPWPKEDGACKWIEDAETESWKHSAVNIPGGQDAPIRRADLDGDGTPELFVYEEQGSGRAGRIESIYRQAGDAYRLIGEVTGLSGGFFEKSNGSVQLETWERCGGCCSYHTLLRSIDGKYRTILQELYACPPDGVTIETASADRPTTGHVGDPYGLVFVEMSAARLDDYLKALGGLPLLTSLSLKKYPLGDSDLTHIAALDSLERLLIVDAPITDEGLNRLKSMRKLRALCIAGGHISPEAIAKLETELPQCRIYTDESEFEKQRESNSKPAAR